MSVSFIRFFSVTQLVPDGLLILFIVTLLYLSFKVTNPYKINLHKKIIQISAKKPSIEMNNYFIKNKRNNKLYYVDNPIYRKSIRFFHLLTLLVPSISLICIIKYTDFINNFFNHFNLPAFLMFWILLIMIIREMITSSIVLFVHIIECKLFKKLRLYCIKKPIFKEIILVPFRLLSVLLAFILILIFFFIIAFFHQEYFLPKNLKNLDNLESSLHNSDYNKSKISYFNDKYIFIEHENSNKDKIIEIIKFDELFKN